MSYIERLLGRDYRFYLERAEKAGERGDWGNARLETLKALELTVEDTDEHEKTAQLLSDYEAKLVKSKLEAAESFRKSGAFDAEIGALETALELGNEKDKKKIEKLLSGALKNLNAHHIDERALPFIEQGNIFMEKNMPAEALVEFREALKLYGELDGALKADILEKSSAAESLLIEPYLEKAQALVDGQKYKEADQELEFAKALNTGSNDDLKKRIDKIKKNIPSKGESEPLGEFVPRAVWDAVIEEYMLAVEQYFAYGSQMENPYHACHRNPFEAIYNNARKKLGSLYLQRANGYFGEEKHLIALKEYQEAARFFGKDDLVERNHILDRIKIIRANREKNKGAKK